LQITFVTLKRHGDYMALIEDVESLKRSPLPEVRETIAKRICDYYNHAVFEGEEEKIACDIIRLFAKDVELRVRKALAESLKRNPDIPHDVAIRLANDELDVAIPILEFSKVLTEGDLLEIIVSTENVGKLIAITKRDDVTNNMSSALVLKRSEEVCSSLFKNKTAQISEETLLIAAEEFAKSGDVVNSLINRGNLPIGVVEKMISFTTDELKSKIEKQLKYKSADSKDIAVETYERATLGLLSDEPIIDSSQKVRSEQNMTSSTVKSEQLARHLYSNKKLTSSIILRAICEGNLDFFEASLSVCSRIPLINVRALVRSAEKNAICSLFQRADFPISVADSICVILEFIKKEKYKGKAFDQNTKQRLIEYIETNKYDSTVPLMPYILALISSDITLSNITS